MAYDIQGTFYEACDCEIICSCWAQIEPDMGQCTGLWAWEITQGSYTYPGSKKKTEQLDGVKVVILSNGKSCDDAVNKLIIIDADGNADKYAATLQALTEDGAWLHVFNQAEDAKTKCQAVAQARITIGKHGKSSADISVSPMAGIDNSPVTITHVVAHTSFRMKDDGKMSSTQMAGDGRLIKAVLGGDNKISGTIDVGQIMAQEDKSTTPATQQGLNLLAEIPDAQTLAASPNKHAADTYIKDQKGYTFDLDIIRASAARGKFHYVNP